MDYDKIRDEINRVRMEREWDKLDNLKDLAESLIVESAELLEQVLWKNPEQVDEMLEIELKREKIEDELADVLLNVICFSERAGIDLEHACLRKIKKIEEHYPLHKAKGNNKKYNEFKE
ncbi:MAG: MazG-like family protein [Candidatus Diapherotrites archaeon]